MMWEPGGFWRPSRSIWRVPGMVTTTVKIAAVQAAYTLIVVFPEVFIPGMRR
jgi:hypothetical protein